VTDPRQITLDDVLGPAKALGSAGVLAKIRRREAGKAAEAHGRIGEAEVARLCTAAREHHVARLEQIATPTRGRNGRRRFAAKSIVDFLGFLMDGTGRVVAIEVKTTAEGEALALARVDEHQREYLDTVLSAGGIALLAAVFGEPVGNMLLRLRTYVVPWADVCARTRVTEGQLLAAGCLTGPEDFLLPYLTTP